MTMSAVLLAALLPPACSRNDRPNILLVTLDTTRADHIAAYGFKQVDTPVLDSLARQGVLFQNAYSHIPMTLPAHTSILSGTYPFYHSVTDNGEFRVPDELLLLPEILKSNGYITAAVISAAVLKNTFNINQGFDFWNEEGLVIPTGGNALLAERRANLTTDTALQWLSSNYKKRFFLWVHFYDPHWPYDPPDPFYQQYSSDEYSGEIAFMDSQLGRIIQFLNDHKLLDKTIIIAIGDHGEGLGEHKERTHSIFIYQATQHIPFIIRVPGIQNPGRKISQVVSQVDVLPTILDFLGLPVPPEVKGQSLKKLITGDEQESQDRQAFMESHFPYLHYGWSELYGIATNRYYFIQAPKPELYDLQNDPAELNNLATQNPKLVKQFQFQIDEIKKASKSNFQELVRKGIELDDQTRRQLEALGYAAGTVTADPEKARHKDPKDFADIFELLNTIQNERFSGNFQNLLEKANRILDKDPENVLAAKMRADAFFGMGKYQQGIDALKKAIEQGGQNADYYYTMGLIYLRLNNLAEARAAFEKSLKLNPRKEQTRYYLARLLLNDAKVKQAFQIIDEGKMRDTGWGHLFMAAYFSSTPGLAGKADSEFEQAEKLLKKSGLVRREYGLHMLQTGRPRQALERFQKAEELDPSFKADTALQNFKRQAQDMLNP